MSRLLRTCYGNIAMKNINVIKLKCIITRIVTVVMLSGLAACAESTLDEELLDTEPALVFPADFFTQGYTESYSVTGSSDTGLQYSGTYEVKTGAETVFNGVPSIPVTRTLEYSTILNGQVTSPVSIVLTEYFTADEPRQYLGSEHESGLVTIAIDQPVEIPEFATPGNFGSIGTYIGSDSSYESLSWSAAMSGDQYLISFTSLLTDSSGGMISDETQSFLIDIDGVRKAWEFTSILSNRNMTLTFTGIRI
jgi:hypothetical protein